MKAIKPLCSALCLVAVAGCGSNTRPPATAPAGESSRLAQAAPTTEPSTQPAAEAQPVWTFAPPRRKTPLPAESEDPGGRPPIQNVVEAGDPPPAFRPVVTLSVFQRSVPAGTVSRNDGFWKRADENAVDVATHDILDRNGIRVALAPIADFNDFMKVLDDSPQPAKPPIYAAPGVKPFEILMKHAVAAQTLYYFDPDGNMPIRGYDESDNLFCVEFQPAPRKPDAVRVGVCPMVRSNRRRLVASGQNDTLEIGYVSDERFFDLKLKVDVPVDSFLIIAPSAEAKSSMSIGNAFLVREGKTQRFEDVILIVPQAARLKTEKPADLLPPPAK